MLCPLHHREVDERQGGTHSHYIRQLPGKGWTYFRVDIRGEPLFERVIEEENHEPRGSVNRYSGGAGGHSDSGSVEEKKYDGHTRTISTIRRGNFPHLQA